MIRKPNAYRRTLCRKMDDIAEVMAAARSTLPLSAMTPLELAAADVATHRVRLRGKASPDALRSARGAVDAWGAVAVRVLMPAGRPGSQSNKRRGPAGAGHGN